MSYLSSCIDSRQLGPAGYTHSTLHPCLTFDIGYRQHGTRRVCARLARVQGGLRRQAENDDVACTGIQGLLCVVYSQRIRILAHCRLQRGHVGGQVKWLAETKYSMWLLYPGRR